MLSIYTTLLIAAQYVYREFLKELDSAKPLDIFT